MLHNPLTYSLRAVSLSTNEQQANELAICYISLLRKTKQWKPAQNTIENVIDLIVIMEIVLVLMETIMVSTGMCI